MAITRVDTSIQLSDTGLPIVASNPLVAPILLSAVIPNGTNQVVATFNTPCSDSGGALGSYTGDAILRECGVSDLTIGVAATQVGDGTITYDVQEALTIGTVYGFTAGGAAFTTCTATNFRLHFNGDTVIEIPLTLDANTPGRIEFIGEVDSVTPTQYFIGTQGGGRIFAYFSVSTPQFRGVLFSTTVINIGGFSPAGGIEYNCGIFWEGAGAGSRGTAFVEGAQNATVQGGDVSTALRFGQNDAGISPLFGYMREVKHYDAEIGGNIIHHWKINDNSNVIKDIVGGIDGALTIGSGQWEII